MRRVAVASAAFALVFFGVPSPANAASEDCSEQTELLGLVCVSIVDDEAVATLRAVPGGPPLVSARVPAPVQTITETVTEYIPASPSPPIRVPVPGPTRTVTATPPAPRTVTETPTPVTSTATVTATPTNTTGGQRTAPSDILGNEAAEVTSPPVEPGSVDLIPDDPKVAATTFSILGLLAGIALGVIGLFIAYRLGQKDGEKATLKEFLGVIRGEPQPGRHRA